MQLAAMSGATEVEDDHSTDCKACFLSSGDLQEDLLIVVATSVMELGPLDAAKDTSHVLRLCPAGRAGSTGFHSTN